MRYDVLLCDADNTVFDFTRAEENAFTAACAGMGIAGAKALLARYGAINEALWKLLERGGITQETLRVRRFEQFLAEIGHPGDARAMADCFADALSRQSVPLPGAEEAVLRWSALLPVVIVTNGISRIQHGRMDRSPMRHAIRGMIISEEVGVAKPDPRMIELGMEAAGVTDRRRVLMLGDSLSSDMAAAANAGVDACWFNPRGVRHGGDLPIAYEIRSLDEVDAILTGREETE